MIYVFTFLREQSINAHNPTKQKLYGTSLPTDYVIILGKDIFSNVNMKMKHKKNLDLRFCLSWIDKAQSIWLTTIAIAEY